MDDSLSDMSNVGNFSLSKLFDKTLLAELISEDVWMDLFSSTFFLGRPN